MYGSNERNGKRPKRERETGKRKRWWYGTALVATPPSFWLWFMNDQRRKKGNLLWPAFVSDSESDDSSSSLTECVFHQKAMASLETAIRLIDEWKMIALVFLTLTINNTDGPATTRLAATRWHPPPPNCTPHFSLITSLSFLTNRVWENGCVEPKKKDRLVEESKATARARTRPSTARECTTATYSLSISVYYATWVRLCFSVRKCGPSFSRWHARYTRLLRL